MRRELEILELIPLEILEQGLLEDLAKPLQELFPLEVKLRRSFPLPRRAYHAGRGQYKATAVLNDLLGRIGSFDKALAVTDRDLFAAGLNFVFGEAHIGRGACIISLARLRPSFYRLPDDPQLFFERTVKEAVHEVGHLYGLGHCPDPTCVMHFSNSLSDTDRKSRLFCPRCQRILSAGRPR